VTAESARGTSAVGVGELLSLVSGANVTLQAGCKIV
jgi:hypothetical protein